LFIPLLQVASTIVSTSQPTALSSIEGLGKIERLDAAKSLDLPILKGADLIAAAVRREPDGGVFYSWDLALAPSVCAAGDEFGGALGCSYDRIFLVSATVQDGKIHTFLLQATAQEWKGRSNTLRALRNSFAVMSPSA
jgi:hypothetical protein